MSGLSPTVIAKLGEGTVEDLTEVLDNGHGTYAVKYAAPHIGSGYALAYSIGFVAEHEGARYTEFWPVEVVREGREGIMSEVGGTNYAYQVRYGWSPGLPQPGDEVTFYFEPRRAIQTGAEINTEKLWPNTFNHLADVKDARFLVQGADRLLAELQRVNEGLRHFAANLLYGVIAELTERETRHTEHAYTDHLVQQVLEVVRRDPGYRALVAVNVRHCRHIRHMLKKYPKVRIVRYSQFKGKL